MRWPWSPRSTPAASGLPTDAPQCALPDAFTETPQCGFQTHALMQHHAGSSPSVSSATGGFLTETGNRDAPPCGEPNTATDAPQGGECSSSSVSSPRGETEFQRAQGALDDIARGWAKTASRFMTARELAIEFRQTMQSRPELIDKWIRSGWIEWSYPLLCAALSIHDRPPFPDFAYELDKLMPRKRMEDRQGGKRVGTYAAYLVPDPATGVVELSGEKRKRA
jgi:hypothetical protein